MDNLRFEEIHELMREVHGIIGIEYYNVFFENEDINVGYAFFSFIFLKLIDSALKYSKKKVYEEFKKSNYEIDPQKLLNNSIFPNGSKVGFYNCSKYDLDSLSEYAISYESYKENFDEFINHEQNFRLLIDNYIDNFDDNMIKILIKLDFDKILDNLQYHNILSVFIKKLNGLSISEKYFDSRVSFLETIDTFITLFNKSWEPYNFFFGDSNLYDDDKLYSVDNKLYYEKITPEYNLLSNLLVQLLFSNIDLNQRYNNNINVYNPSFDRITLLEKSRKFINETNPKCNVKLYGKLNFNDSIIEFIKLTIYYILNDENDLFLSDSNKYGIPFKNISEKNIDFIISDFSRLNDSYLNMDVINDLIKKQLTDSIVKAAVLIRKTQFDKELIEYLILNDYLESIITFKEKCIIIINSNKSKKLKDKFILIDDTINKNINLKYDELKIESKSILDCYHEFKEKNISKVFCNNVISKPYIEDYEYHEFIEDMDKFCDDAFNMDYGDFMKIYEDALMKEHQKDLNKSMNTHQKSFNFNNLMYDKKRKNYLGNKKSEIIEEKLKFIQLSSIITFDGTKLNEEEISRNKIEKFGETFFINSNKILKRFLEYYLESGKGVDEFNYFKEGFGFESEDFIFMRIPLVDIETQKNIIKVVQLSEEYFNLVKEFRDNFQANILNYEQFLKDMSELNRIKLDVKNVKIEKNRNC